MLARPFSVLILFVSVVFTSCAKEAAGLPSDLLDAVPADAVLVWQIRSADELAKHGNEFQQIAAPGEPATTGASLVAKLLVPLAAPLDQAQIDTSRPMAMALRLDAASPMPILTYILPARDAQALAGAKIDGQLFTQVFGDYVALSTAAIPAAAEQRSRLFEGASAGMFTARIDLAKIVGRYRPMIDAGLEQAQMMSDSGMLSDPASPIDPSEMVEVYLDFARELLDSADILGISVELADPEASLSFVLENRAGSPLAKYARTEKVDFEELAGRIDPAATMQMLWSYPMGSMAERMWPMYEGMITNMGESSQVRPEFAEGFRTYMERSRALMAKFGPVAATSFDFAPDGMRFAAYYEAPEPQALADEMKKLFVDPALAGMGMVIEPPRDVEIAGKKGISTRFQFDMAQMGALLDASADGTTTPDPEAERAMAAMFGSKGLELTLLPASEGVVIVGGGDAAWQAVTAKRMVSGGKASSGLARAVDSIDGANPAMVVLLDVTRLLGSVSNLVRRMDPADRDLSKMDAALTKLGDKPLVANFHWGVKGTTWKAGLAIDREGMRRLITAMQD